VENRKTRGPEGWKQEREEKRRGYKSSIAEDLMPKKKRREYENKTASQQGKASV